MDKEIDVNSKFIGEIINGMQDWVRVIDRDDNVLFINNAMAEGLKSTATGKKCYELIGRAAPCENCISRKAVFSGQSQVKEEIIGDQVFSVMSSPVRDGNGEITSVVEVLRNITETKQLQQKILEQNRKLRDDLSMAKMLQCSLLPKKLPEEKLSFSFIYKPCETLGGDFLDIFEVDRDHVGIYIADVSGHGVSASMLTVFLRSSINRKTLSPATALGELYREFNLNYPEQDMYITVFYAIINVAEKTMTYSNAGHNVMPIIFNKSRFELLSSPGIPISNWTDSPSYQDKTTGLSSGDRFFLYTDGIIEIRNPDNEQFGEDRLADILTKDKSEPGGTLNRVIEAACVFSDTDNPREICDDITMALVEIK